MDIYGEVSPVVSLASEVVNAQTTIDVNAVHYIAESKTDSEKAQARSNIGAGTYSKPSGGIPQTDIEPNAFASKADQTSLDRTNGILHNVTELLKGSKYSVNTDSTTAYTKTVPAGAMPNAELSILGGKTIVWNQLFKKISYNSGGVRSSDDGKITIESGRTTHCYITPSSSGIDSSHLVVGHKFLISIGGTLTSGQITLYWDTSNYNVATAFTSSTASTQIVTPASIGSNSSFMINSSASAGDYYPQLFDLTQMFGAGNEPATVAQFKAMFPNSYYAYDAGSLKSASVDKVVSKKADNTLNAETQIPSAIQSLAGYGWSAGTVYNYIDWQEKKYHQRVGSVDLGTLNWTRMQTGSNYSFYTPAIDNGSKVGICAKYNWVDGQDIYGGTASDKSIGLQAVRHRFRVRDDSYTDAQSFKTAMSGVMLYYELATEIVTDISSIIGGNNLIGVESGGTVTMHQTGTDNGFCIPVPSTLNYMIELANSI